MPAKRHSNRGHAGNPPPAAHRPRRHLRGVRGVLTDIDDTLTRDGAIEPATLAALHALRAAGIPVVAITGPPGGLERTIVRAWPVAAIVPENGAVALIPDSQGGVLTEYAQNEATRSHNAHRLREVATRVLAEVHGATLARDSAGRATDIAIDHSEFAHLDEARIARVVALMQGEGMTATVSSIHINGWFGSHSKWTGAQWIVPRLFGEALDVARWVYVGDSTNDQEMFARFPLSVGVANLMRFAAQLHTWPAWITKGERGAGFAEVARALIDAR